METSIVERVKKVRSENKVSQIEFANTLGVSASYIAGLEMGRNSLNQKFLQAIKEKYNVSIDWLMFGEEAVVDIDKNILKILMSLDNYNGIIVDALNAEIKKMKEANDPDDIKMLESNEFIKIHSRINELETIKSNTYKSILEEVAIEDKPKKIIKRMVEYSDVSIELYSLIHDMMLEIGQLDFVESLFNADSIRASLKKITKQ
jgi:transcriptional regulator with XRE-family HTH domain